MLLSLILPFMSVVISFSTPSFLHPFVLVRALVLVLVLVMLLGSSAASSGSPLCAGAGPDAGSVSAAGC